MIDELLDSPGWQHRKDNIDFSPFDPYSPDIKKKKNKKLRSKKVINSNLDKEILNEPFDIMNSKISENNIESTRNS